MALSVPQLVDWGELVRENQHTEELERIRAAIQKGEGGFKGYHLENSLLLYRGRLVLHRDSAFVPILLREYHDSRIGGHSGVEKTYRRVKAEFFWKGLRGDVEDMVSKCDICQRNKYQACAPSGLLQPLVLPNKIWEEVTMDFIEGLPKSEGYTIIMVVVDRLSKYSHFIPLRHPFSAPTVASTFIREVVRLHGVPTSIVSDRDKVFLSSFWKELFKMQGTFLKRSTAYHPQTDGQSEVVNRSVETYLRCFAGERPKQWVKWLSWAEYWYNTCYHTASQFTPFKILYGRDPPPLVNYQKGTTPVYLVDQYLEERDRVLEELKEHLLRAQQIMKTRADSHCKNVTFEVGEMVYLKLRPYRQKTVANRRSEKLSPRYYGPFEIERKVGMVAYRLKLPPQSSIHPVFHVSLLKRSIGENIMATPTIPRGLTGDMQFLLKPLQVKEVRKNDQGKREVLIEWKDLPTHEATWEIYEAMQEQFPDFNLEDKVDLLEGGIDGPAEPVHPRPLRVYRRRRRGLRPGRAKGGGGVGVPNLGRKGRGSRGTEGSTVKLDIHSGPEIKQMALRREKITLNPVKLRLCEVPGQGNDSSRIGYIKLTSFNQNTSGAVRDAIESLRRSGVKSFVLDLRDNSGGLFAEGIETAKIWLEKGVIVYICDSRGVRDIYEADGSNAIAASEPLIVLVSFGLSTGYHVSAFPSKHRPAAVSFSFSVSPLTAKIRVFLSSSFATEAAVWLWISNIFFMMFRRSATCPSIEEILFSTIVFIWFISPSSISSSSSTFLAAISIRTFVNPKIPDLDYKNSTSSLLDQKLGVELRQNQPMNGPKTCSNNNLIGNTCRSQVAVSKAADWASGLSPECRFVKRIAHYVEKEAAFVQKARRGISRNSKVLNMLEKSLEAWQEN
ncbi:hypothetical protein KFK09_018678 [Dendrobium nobile]|uniref:Integrase catalytic domain-containing protein n=1 Tax=Dendrobium nobile TaxID=94219 RepID=A0A8T3B1V8_DENNO|nr:hypothetical protein KFK09_018678 [Dendrobium nobile]